MAYSVIIVLMAGLQGVNTQICPSTTYGNVDLSNIQTSTAVAVTYLLKGDGSSTGIGAMNCYGTVQSFRFQCYDDGSVTFQVWTPTTGSKYKLVGSYSTTVTCISSTDSVDVYEQVSCLTGWQNIGGSWRFWNTCNTKNNQNSGTSSWCTSHTYQAVKVTGIQTWRFYSGAGYTGTYSDVTGSAVPACTAGYNTYLKSFQRLGTIQTVTIPNTWQRIPIKPGDYIGIYHSTNNHITYTSYTGGSSAGTETIEKTWGSAPTVGSEQDFPATITTSLRRSYSLEVTVGPGSAPYFYNLYTSSGTTTGFSVTVFENVALGTEVFKAKVVDENASGLWKTSGDTMTFAKGTGGSNADYFDVDATTGAVTTSKYLDYETLKSSTPHAEVEMIVYDGGLGGGYSATATLTVTVQDVNDEKQTLNLPAGVSRDAQTLTAAGQQIYQIQAQFVLPSTKTAGTCCLYQMLSLSPSDGSYYVDNSTGWVMNSGDLSDTTVSSWTLEAAAVDLDGTFTSGSYFLYITLTNLKTPPRFDNLPAVIDIREDSSTAQQIYSITAVDSDNDIHTTLTTAYGLSVSPNTGMFELQGTVAAPALWTKLPLSFDFETTPQYVLNVSVTDQLNYTTYSVLTVNILNVNEAPTCLPSTIDTSINEKLPVSTVVPGIEFNVTDPEFSSGDYISWSIESGTESDYFVTSGTKMALAKFIDLGTADSKLFTVSVKGVDTGGLYCSTQVNITVLNVNDPHAVVGAPASITLDAKTVGSGYMVTTITATPKEDMDVFTYTLGLVSPSDGLFSLDAQNGGLTTTRALTDVITPQYRLPITVTDQTGLAAGPETLVIYITNIKQKPVISNLPSSAFIPENTVTETLLFTVFATDTDNDLDPSTYTIESVEPSAGLSLFQFVASGNNGELRTVAGTSCDHEVAEEFTLLISVKDSEPYTSEGKNLTLICTDVNEPPTFNSTSYTVTINEELPINTALTLSPAGLDAYDVDAGDSITFQILPGTNSHYFNIMGNTVAIAEVIDTDPSGPTSITLNVTARDKYGLASEQTAIVLITINDLNDHAPTFASSTYSDKLQENSYGGTSVLLVAASDGDMVGSDNKRFTYSINDTIADEFFQVDSTSGLISVKHQIDYDKYPLMVFEVLAIDQGYPALTGTTTVSILVEDINDGRPTFVQDFFNTEIPSNSPMGLSIVTLNATDLESFSTLTYSYLKYSAYFGMDGSAGELSVRENLLDNYKYLLYFIAKDNGIPPQTSNVAIVRVDTFNSRTYSVDIHLAVTLREYESVQDRFISALSRVLQPWTPRVHRVVGEVAGRRRLLQTTVNTKTVVSVHALHNTDADSIAHLENGKAFVSKDDLLKQLRENLYGTPSDSLKSSEFADFLVTHVEPTEEVWLIDTVAGIAILTLISLLILAATAGLILLCYRRSQWFRSKGQVKHVPPRPLTPGQPYNFNLNYNNKQPGGLHAGPSGVLANRKNRRVSTPPTTGSGNSLDENWKQESSNNSHTDTDPSVNGSSDWSRTRKAPAPKLTKET